MKKQLPFFLCTLNLILSAFSLNAQQPRLMLPVGHVDYVSSASFSPDGKWVVTASYDNTAKVWNAATGQLVTDIEGTSAVFSPDGKSILTASLGDKTNTAKIWDVVTGRLIISLKGHTDWVYDAAYSPDGRWVVTSSRDSTAKVWDAATGQLVADLKGHSGWVKKAAFSPDGKLIVTSSPDRTGKVWNAANGHLISNLEGHTRDVVSAAFSPDGKLVATASTDSTARVWDAATGQLQADLKGHTGTVNSITFSPDGKWVVTASNDSTARIWNVATGQLVTGLKGHTDWVNNALFSPDGKLIITASYDNTAGVWNAVTGQRVTDLKGHTGWIFSAAFSPDGKFIVTASNDHSAKVWNTSTGQLAADLKGHTSIVNGTTFSPDGKLMLTISGDSTTKVWDAAGGKLVANLKGHSGLINSAAFSPGGEWVVTASRDSTAKVWNTASGQLVADLTGHTDEVYAAVFSPDGKSVVTASDDQAVKIWNAATGQRLADIKGHLNMVNSTALSPEGKLIVVTSADRVAKVWNAATGQLIADLKGHTRYVNSAAISQNGKWVVTASDDSTARVWDAATGQLVTSLKGLTSYVNSAVFSPDGNEIVTVSDDYTARVWNAAAGRLVTELRAPAVDVYSASFSPDGKWIGTISSDNNTLNMNKAEIWNAADGSLVTVIQAEKNETFAGIDFVNNRIASINNSELSVYNIISGKKLSTSLAVDRTEYLVYDSSGRYDGTQEARKLLYFVCDNEVIELNQVKDQLWVPNLAERIMKGDTINTSTLNDLNICGLTPEIKTLESSTTEYRFKISPRHGGLGETVLFVNGIEAKRYKAGQLKKNGSFYELVIKKNELQPYFISGQENAVTVRAYTGDNAISSRGVKITDNGDRSSAAPPNLYAVMIGVSEYKGNALKLKYAAKDATDISNAVANAAGKLLNTDGKEHVFMYNLTTAKDYYRWPEKSSIKKTLEDIGKLATANDILLIFFAGHGLMTGEADKKQFYFLTADASTLSSTDALKDVGISTTELTELMKPQNMKAQKRILIFDACNSGQAINDIAGRDLAVRNDDKAQQIKAIDKLNEKSGLFILSASATNQSAYEMGRYSQGLLTYSLLKAIKQEPGILEDAKYLNVSRWFDAAEKTVTEISKENGVMQEPQIVSNTNFNIGIVDPAVSASIVFPNEKPLFTAGNFQNNDAAVSYDDMDITRQLNEAFLAGSGESVIYMASTDSPDAYFLSGRYEVNGDDLTIQVNLMKSGGKVPKYKFEINGKQNDVKTLGEQIVRLVIDWIAKNK